MKLRESPFWMLGWLHHPKPIQLEFSNLYSRKQNKHVASLVIKCQFLTNYSSLTLLRGESENNNNINSLSLILEAQIKYKICINIIDIIANIINIENDKRRSEVIFKHIYIHIKAFISLWSTGTFLLEHTEKDCRTWQEPRTEPALLGEED